RRCERANLECGAFPPLFFASLRSRDARKKTKRRKSAALQNVAPFAPRLECESLQERERVLTLATRIIPLVTLLAARRHARTHRRTAHRWRLDQLPMPAVLCPRCQRANPDAALFCHFDGIELKPGAGAALHKLAREFRFPSGRCCRSFDEFAQGCQDDWTVAPDFLKNRRFGHSSTTIHRLDLARAAQEAMAQKDADIALATFLGALPVSRAQMPRLDLNPRRILLGNLVAGEVRQVQLTVSNQGQGTLQ